MISLGRTFEQSRPKYERLAKILKSLIPQLAENISVKIFIIEDRVKTRSSFDEKTTRDGKKGKYKKLEDMTDLCGLRVVLFSVEDCERLIREIRNHFEIDEANSVDKSKDRDDDRFGYTSTHLIISLSASRAKFFEYHELTGLWAELQIRTVLQHAWAVLDWESRYKSKVETPKEIRRKLFRLSASLEEADEVFSAIINETNRLKAQYRGQLTHGDLQVPLNKISLGIFAKESSTLSDLLRRCYTAGLIPPDTEVESSTPWKWLITNLNTVGIQNIEQLEAVMNLRAVERRSSS